MAGLLNEIKGRQADFMKCFNSGNAAGAAEFYDPDGFFMPHGRDPVNGRSGALIEDLFPSSTSFTYCRH